MPRNGIIIAIILSAGTVGVMLANGCGRTQPPAEPQAVISEESAEYAEIDRQAPREWANFEKWVIREIQTLRESVPLPNNPKLAEPLAHCIRLDQLLRAATIDSPWQGVREESKPLRALGPFRSDRPGARFQSQKVIDRLFGAGYQMVVTGLEIQAEDVGRITIRLRAPAGKHLDLRWSEGGFARLPIPDNANFWTLSLDTNGLTHWEGRLDELFLRTDDASDTEIYEIETIQFWGNENAFPRPVDVRAYSVDDRRRYVIYAHTPAEIRFPDVLIPSDGKLSVGLAAVMPDQRANPGAHSKSPEMRFIARVECDGAARDILDRTLAVGTPWTDESAALGEWAGRQVTLIFRNEADDPRAVALWGNPTVYQAQPDPPIMILYLIDAFSAKHASLYGYYRPTTPTMAKLAADGVWFANMYANSPVTITSVPNTLLSMPAERHGVFHASIAAPMELVTIADALQAAGFATASFITNANAGARQNMDQGFDEYHPHALFHWSERTSADRSVPIEDVLDWFERHRDRPAFAYIHTCEPHAPYVPPPGYRGRFDTNYTGRIDGTLSATTGFYAAKTPEDIEHVRALYDEECLFADEQLGRFLDRMRGAGFAERMNLLVIADHGEELQEHGHWGHGEGLYDEVMRVPLVAAGPLITARGRQDLPVQLYDIMPTILDLFELPEPYALTGVSLKSLLQVGDRPQPADLSPERTIFISHHRYRGRNQIEYAAVEAARWKLHYRYMWDDQPSYPTPARFELYDLHADPGETNDLIGTDRATARRLMCKLVAYARQQRPYESHRGDGMIFDPRQLRELQDMGYIERAEEPTPEAPPASGVEESQIEHSP